MKKPTFHQGLSLMAAVVLSAASLLAAVPVQAATAYVTRYGGNGTGNGQVKGPTGMDFDADGNMYVVDRVNYRIQKWSSDGTYISQFGSAGSANGQFTDPWDIAVSPDGELYVTDQSQNRVSVFESDGTFLTRFGTTGTGDEQFDSPRGIDFDSQGNFYVAEYGNDRIQKFTAGRESIAMIGSLGSGDGQVSNPMDVTVDAADNIYVADMGNNRIQKLSSTGTFMMKWGTLGASSNQLNSPFSVAYDASNDEIYVGDFLNNRVVRYSNNGTFIEAFGSAGTAPGQLGYVAGVAYHQGKIYASDLNHWISVFEEAIDETDPILSNIKLVTTTTSATVTWNTDEPTNGWVVWSIIGGSLNPTAAVDTNPRTTAHTIVLTGLEPCTEYRYVPVSEDASDNQASPSLTNFTTKGCPGSGTEDADEDGLADTVESQGPNNGDANGDGTPDGEQPNVTTLVNTVSGKYSVLESDCESTSIVNVDKESGTAQDMGYDYPAGLMNFILNCDAPGQTATITQYHYGSFDHSTFSVRKYFPVSSSYLTLPGSTLESVTIGGQKVLKVQYKIADGSMFDLDGATNGSIKDPAGPGRSAVNAPSTGLGGSTSR